MVTERPLIMFLSTISSEFSALLLLGNQNSSSQVEAKTARIGVHVAYSQHESNEAWEERK
jgi:hypothetical protein